jgi:hypothetical protein
MLVTGKVSPQGQEENPQQGPNQGTSQPNQSRGTGRTGQESDEAGGGKILALTTGFVAPPFGLMHCDTLQVFTKGWVGGGCKCSVHYISLLGGMGHLL